MIPALYSGEFSFSCVKQTTADRIGKSLYYAYFGPDRGVDQIDWYSGHCSRMYDTLRGNENRACLYNKFPAITYMYIIKPAGTTGV